MSSRSETALTVYRRLSPALRKVEDAGSTAVAAARRASDVPAIHKLTDGVELIYPAKMADIDPAEFKAVLQDPIVGVEVGVASKRRLAGLAAGGAAVAGVGFGSLGYQMYDTDLTIREALIQQGVPVSVVDALPDSVEALTLDTLLQGSTLVVDGDKVSIDRGVDNPRMGQSLVDEPPPAVDEMDAVVARLLAESRSSGPAPWKPGDPMSSAMRAAQVPAPRSTTVDVAKLGAWNRLTGATGGFAIMSEAQLVDFGTVLGLDFTGLAAQARKVRGE